VRAIYLFVRVVAYAAGSISFSSVFLSFEGGIIKYIIHTAALGWTVMENISNKSDNPLEERDTHILKS